MFNFKIAIRNLSRHKYRTYLTGGAIALIAFILVFGLSVANGISDGLINNLISLNTGHVTINIMTNSETNDTSAQITNWNKQIIDDVDYISSEIEKLNYVSYTTKRVNINGIMISEDKTSNGVFVGVEPSKEQDLLNEGIPVNQGNILPNNSDERWIYISNTTANLYNVGIGDKLTLVSQTRCYKQNNLEFVVSGIFKKSAWKEFYSYINLKDSQELAGLGESVTQIKVILDERDRSEEVEEIINASLGEKYDIVARNWRKAGEFFLGTVTIIEASVYVMCFVLFLLVALMLINTVSMAVYEQTNEIGVLMMMGASKREIIMLYINQSFILSAIATGIEEIVGVIVTLILSKVGIPAFVEVMKLGFGADNTYPELKISFILVSFFTVVFLSISVTLVPIMRISKLNPVEAINHTI